MVITLHLCISYGSRNKQQLLALYIINRLDFITEVGVFTARYGLTPYITQIHFVLKGFSEPLPSFSTISSWHAS
jgi:hypothetical protein